MRILFVLLALTIWSSSPSASARDKGDGLRVFSHVEFNQLEGEYDGLQIVLVPYDGGKSILWRSANGSLDKPLLLDVHVNGNTMTVVVPESNQLHGVWKLTFLGESLQAVGPRGLHFRLTKLQIN